jgi:hypothetical protein
VTQQQSSAKVIFATMRLTSSAALTKLRALEINATKQAMLKHALLILQNRQRASVGRVRFVYSDGMEC